MSTAAKLIASIEEAIAGDFARVTIDGETWARVKDIHSDQQEIMRINNELRLLLLECRKHVSADLLARISAAVK